VRMPGREDIHRRRRSRRRTFERPAPPSAAPEVTPPWRAALRLVRRLRPRLA
jgi:hypothetical protein